MQNLVYTVLVDQPVSSDTGKLGVFLPCQRTKPQAYRCRYLRGGPLVPFTDRKRGYDDGAGAFVAVFEELE
jgi:hypothetical protein